MNYDPSPKQALFIWRLISGGGGEWRKNIKPEISKTQRDQLVRAGLIEIENRKQPTGRRAMYITVADKGWQWAHSHCTCDFPRAATAVETLQLLLARLEKNLVVRRLSLAEFISPSNVEDSIDGSAESATAGATEQGNGEASIEQRIEGAYFKLSDQRANVRVKVADLREMLNDIPADSLNETLLNMDKEGKLSLMRLTNPLEITPHDEAAVVRTPSGEPRHIVYMGGQAS